MGGTTYSESKLDLSPERLVRDHGPRLRTLAASLVGEGADADEVVQRTWIAAWKANPRHATAWLDQVVRRVALRFRRDEAASRERERRAARPEALPDEASSSLEHSEALQALAAGLASLPREWAEVVLLRYADGLPQSDVADRLGIPVNTVRSRARRGMARLREELERSGTDWHPALAFLAAPCPRPEPVAAASLGALLMSSNTIVAVALLVVAALGVGAHKGLGKPSPGSSPRIASFLPAIAGPDSGPQLDKPELSAHGRQSYQGDERRGLPAPFAAKVQDDRPPQQDQALLKGRFLLPNGKPAVGVQLAVHGWIANQGREKEFGNPRNWIDIGGATNGEGRFELGFFPPQAYQFVLSASLEAHGDADWRWHRIKYGEAVDVGDVTLVPAGVIVGRIVDSDGGVLTEGWGVSAETEIVLGTGSGRDETTVRASPDPATGEFRLVGVSALRVRVEAQSRSGLSARTEWVEVSAGEETFVELVPAIPRRPRGAGVLNDRKTAAGPDPARRLTILTYTHPSGAVRPDPKSAVLVAEDGTRRTATPDPRSPLRLFFDDLDEGEYRLEIDDPHFLPWSKDRVGPRQQMLAKLVGGGAIELEVVDAETGGHLPTYGLRVAFPASHSWPREFELLPDDSRASKNAIGNLPATDLILIVRTHGRPDARVEVLGLERGKARHVRVEATRGVPISGSIVDAEGNPQPGVEVEWTLGPEPGYAGAGSRSGVPIARDVFTSDAEGRFTIEGAGTGVHTLRVRWSPWLWVDRTLTLPGKRELTVTQPPLGWLEGRMILPPPEEDLEVAIDVRTERSKTALLPGGPGGTRVDLEADGSFRVGPLPAGEVQVEFGLQYLGLHSSSGKRYPLEVVTIEEGETLTREWDLRDSFPGRIDVRLRHGGAPLEEAWIEAVSDDPLATSGISSTTRGAPGLVQMKGFTPAAWTLIVRSQDGGWAFRSPTRVVVEPSGRHELVIEVPLHERRVRFVRPNGDGLAGSAVHWEMDGAHRPARAFATADEAGELLLTLAPGEVRFGEGARPDPEQTQTTVTWEPGEAVIVVELR